MVTAGSTIGFHLVQEQLLPLIAWIYLLRQRSQKDHPAQLNRLHLGEFRSHPYRPARLTLAEGLKVTAQPFLLLLLKDKELHPEIMVMRPSHDCKVYSEGRLIEREYRKSASWSPSFTALMLSI
ncbi:MAG: hypothetical protein C4293_06425 [Nitrospiraceae bacterium]